MAYRRSSSKMTKRKKIEPAVSRMAFTVPVGTSYIDLSLCASIANRRSYSQGLAWALSGFSIFSTAGATGLFTISKLPETWIMTNAWHKSKILWNKMNDQVLDDQPGIKGKYADFKVNMDVNMTTETIQTQTSPNARILTPHDRNGQWTAADYTLPGVSPRADWVYSTVQIPNATTGVPLEFGLHAVGPDVVGSKGLIAGYSESRARPQTQDPNVPIDGGWMNDLFDVGGAHDEIHEDLVNDNDRPPYAVSPEATASEFYPGGSLEFPDLQLHAANHFSTTTVSQHINAIGGVFQCGLVRLDNGTGAVASLFVDLIPGYQRGYTTGKMEDV